MMYMKLPIVSMSPHVMGILTGHIQEHISLKAREMVATEIQGLISQVELMVQSGSIDPQIAQQQIMEVKQQMQNPEELEKAVALQEMKLMKDMVDKMQPEGQDPMSDPLVQIRMQELDIKQKDLQRKALSDAASIDVQEQRMQQQAVTDSARIESTEDIAQVRDRTNRVRIDVQRDAMEKRNAGQQR